MKDKNSKQIKVIRTIKQVQNRRILLDLTSEISVIEVEIIVLTKDPAKQKKKSLKGALQKYARPEFISQEPNAWENALEEKYGDR